MREPAVEKFRFGLVCGMPRVDTEALENCLLACVGAKGIAPRTEPARVKSAFVARTMLLALTAPRPKSAARTPPIAFVKRALR